jgi:FkbM family methyltransferase
VLVDIGVSGGLDAQWRHFGNDLRAFGFDPWIDECMRLAREEKSDKIDYIAALVGIVDESHWYHQKIEGEPGRKHREYTAADRVSDPYPRTSVNDIQRAQGRLNQSPVEISSQKIQIDKFVRETGLDHVDFIKIDTDGDDFEALLGCEGVIDSHNVLGFCIETQFHGPVSDRSNTFANLDRFLRSKGFLLFDTSMHRYSRSALPSQFVLNIAAQTEFGQLMWGDAVYLRDPAAPDYAARWSVNFAPHQILKLACLFEIYSMPDCAAELILAYRAKIDGLTPASDLLDLLTPRLDGKRLSYEAYMAKFAERLDLFFPVSPDTVVDLGMPSDGLTSSDREAILEGQVDVLKQAVALKDAELAEKTYSLDRLQALYTEMLRQQIEQRSDR